MNVPPLHAVALVSLCLLLLPSARAEEETPPEGLVDVSWHLDPLAAGLQQLGASPRNGGHDGALAVAWRDNLKRRVGRMKRRVKDLKKKGNWVEEEEGGKIRGLEPAKWSPFVRNLAALHTELGTCAEGYAKVRIGPERAMRKWLRAHPGPLPIGIVPSRPALLAVWREIRALQVQNLVVPHYLWEEQRRLEAAVFEEEERAREERRREYEAAKQQALAAIEQDVARTNDHLDEIEAFLTTSQRTLRALVSTTQQVEEYRLRRMLEDVTLDEKQQADIDKLFAKMEEGREKAMAFAEKHLSRYGAEIQQGWMVPRTKLLQRIEKARAEASD